MEPSTASTTPGGNAQAMSLSLQDYQSDAGIAKWVAEIGCTDAVIPRRNIKVALEFFANQMAELSLADAASFLAAMDLSKPVNRVYLQPGDRLIGFRTPTESPFKLFFARRGSSRHASGINPANRGPVHFVVRSTVVALESFTTGAIDTWTPRQPGQTISIAPRAQKWFGKEFGVMAMAGGQQLIVPASYSTLLVEQRG
jgi:hypothetical protein